jgi:hypothetical protein
MIGAIIGSLLGGVLLSFVCFFLYKWNKNRHKHYNNNEVDRGHDEYTTNNEPMSTLAPVINESYFHGRESIPSANNEIQELKQEIQDLRQIILKNNKRSTGFFK